MQTDVPKKYYFIWKDDSLFRQLYISRRCNEDAFLLKYVDFDDFVIQLLILPPPSPFWGLFQQGSYGSSCVSNVVLCCCGHIGKSQYLQVPLEHTQLIIVINALKTTVGKKQPSSAEWGCTGFPTTSQELRIKIVIVFKTSNFFFKTPEMFVTHLLVFRNFLVEFPRPYWSCYEAD